jgi:enoyl-CoA hydratase/carnithine racemase
LIALEKQGGLWTVTLNRPDKANALTEDMLRRLADIAEQAGEDAEVRALILSGAGKVFSAGADLDAARAGLTTSPVWERLSGAVAALPCLTVAALNGTCAGGALGMVLACDLRVAVPGARFFYPVMRHGFLPQPSDPGRMAGLIGRARTSLILMSGHRATAQEALAWGLIDVIAEPDGALAQARALAADVLGADAEVARTIKAMCRPGVKR